LVREDPKTAEAMLVRLSDLLRLTLEGGGGGELPLAEELSRLELYLAIQRMRFGSRLDVKRRIDPASLAARVPSMLLQPLVENSLENGIGPRPGPGTIEIGATRDGGRVRLSVKDDGIGLTRVPRERTGVTNTRARLAALFAGDFTFEMTTPAGGGTLVAITIPFQPL